MKNFSPNLIECAGTILGWQIEKAHTKIGKIIKGLRLRTKADEHIPTYDYELQSRCKKPGDGFGDGLVTDSVTGQNPGPEPITALVTDKPLTQKGKNIEIPAEIKEATAEVNQGSISNAGDNAGNEVSVNPSPSPEPLPAANPDPSPHLSPHSSPHPSPKFKTGNRVKVQFATDLNDSEVELVEFIRTALANDDVEFAGMIQEILQDLCKEGGAANRGKVWAALTKEEQSAFRALLVKLEINPTDAQKMREIASTWWEEYYPQDMQSLITQMFGWNEPGSKYIRYAIKRWLKNEDLQTQERIVELLDLKESSPQS